MCGKIIKLESGAIQKIGTVSPHQGILPLLKGDVERIMNYGSAEIRCFRPWRGDDFRELDSSEPSQIVELKDLVVGFMRAGNFERAHGIKVHDIALKPHMSNVQTSYNLSVEALTRSFPWVLCNGIWEAYKPRSLGCCIRPA